MTYSHPDLGGFITQVVRRRAEKRLVRAPPGRRGVPVRRPLSQPFAPQAQLLEYHAAALAEQRERLCVLLSPPPGRREALGPEERHSRVNRLLAHSHARLSEVAAETERVRRYTAGQERELTALLQQQQQQQQQAMQQQQQQQQQRQQPFACGPALHDVGADGSNGHYGGAVGGDGAYWEGNTLVIEIPNIQQAASFLIGKKGVVIEKLQDTHNCKIQIEKEPLGEAPLRKVFVTSHISRDNCERCAEGIAKKMVEFTELQGQKSVPPNFRAPQAAAGGFCGGFNSGGMGGGMGGGINADMNMMANQGFGVPGIGNSGGTPSLLGAPSQIESD